MWPRISVCLFTIMSAVLTFVQPAAAQKGDRDNWELLGSQKVGFLVDRDVIKVGRREGRFEKIQLRARDNDVYILDLKVVFHNNDVQDIQVREDLRAGRSTRPLDLKGGDRVIKEIQIVYRAKPNFKGSAVVEVWGDQARGGFRPGPGPGTGPLARWDELGCQKVGFLIDRDVIKVGRQEGRFSAIKLRVSDNKVHIMDLKVVYANGAPDDIQVREEIRAGGETRPLDLRGERRAIRQVEMVYRSQPSLKGQAKVCVWGRH